MENNTLLAIFALLAVTVALVPLAKWAGLGTVLGYLAAGALIGPYGLRLISDTETIRTVSEFGIVMMLFLIGLDVKPLELWRMRHRVLGLGLTQLLGTALVLGSVAYFGGLSWQAATIVGLALAMSSTAIAMQSVAQRSLTRTDTGRATLSILLVQDVAVIPILAAIPILAVTSGSPAAVAADGLTSAVRAIDNPSSWEMGLQIVAVFAATIVAGRFLIHPLMRFVAQTGVREAFTALGLALVVGAALVMQTIGLSPALGAFMGGVLLADSEYRHELESNIEPFKGLFLGLFFISVGMSIAFSVVAAQPLTLAATVVTLVGIKIGVIYVIARFVGMAVADRLLIAILLSQAGEFAFVVLQFATSSGVLASEAGQFLMVAVALSMATTPIVLFAFDRVMAPRLNDPAPDPAPETIDSRQKVIVLGYGRFGQIVTRLLQAQGFEMTLIDDDPTQIELVKRFGVKVFYGDGSRLEVLRAAGAENAAMIVIALAGGDRITATAAMIRRNFPELKIAARAVDRRHAHELMALGVEVLERETFRSALQLGVKALVALGYAPHQASRLAHAFERHDTRLLHESYKLRHDQDAYVWFIRRSADMLGEVMRADREDAAVSARGEWVHAADEIDTEAKARSE